MTTKAAITDLLALAIKSEKTKSMKVRQVAKMKAGKLRKVLAENQELRYKFGVEL